MDETVLAVIEQYQAVLADRELFGQGFCWTVVLGPRSESEVVSVLSPGPVVQLGATALEDAVEASFDLGGSDGASETLAWVINGGSWLGLLEFGGYAGASFSTLASLAGVAEQVVSVCWLEAHLRCQLSFAQGDQVEIVEDLVDPEFIDLESFPRLGETLRTVLAVDHDDVRALGLTAVQVATGVPLTENDLVTLWPLIRFAVREDERLSVEDRPWLASNGLIREGETALFDALDAATPANRLIAQTTLVDHALRVRDLYSEPVAVSVADSLANGARPGVPVDLFELIQRLDSAYKIANGHFSDDGAWRRSRGAFMLREFCFPSDTDLDNTSRYRGWHQAMLALGETEWAAARSTAMQELRRS